MINQGRRARPITKEHVMAKPKTPLYVLPHGIEVIGEYPCTEKNPYCRVRVRPHPFFVGAKIVCDGHLIRRNRVILSSMLGRALERWEIAHHKNEDRSDDSPENLELLTTREHNAHHKTGAKHTDDAKRKISKSLKSVYQKGRKRSRIVQRDDLGRIICTQ